MITKIVFILFTALVIPGPLINDITLIDVDAHLEVLLLDRLDPGAKKTQHRYFEDQIGKQAIQLFQQELKESKKSDLLIEKSIETHIPVDDRGFPNPSIVKSAIKKLNKNNIDLSPYIQITTNVRIEGDAIGENDMLQRIQPNIQVILKVFGQDGKLRSKSMATSVYDKFISSEDFTEPGFSKSNKEHIDLLMEKINGSLQASISRATKKLEL